MEISVEIMTKIDYKKDLCNGYTVYVEDHRILTITTYHGPTAAKWIKDVQKSHRARNGSLIVGVCIGRETPDYNVFTIQLCVGSHCLIFHLPEPYCDDTSCKFLNDFFSDPRVVAVGVGMKSTAKNLEEHHGITIMNAVELRSLAFKALQRHDLDLANYDLDRLAKAVLGKHVDVIRPAKEVSWYPKQRGYYVWWSRKMKEEKVKFCTVDPLLCFWIGSELFDVLEGRSSSSAASVETKKKEKKKTKKNVNKNK